ncbi:MAG: DNA recombination protein RmuC [bacterium]
MLEINIILSAISIVLIILVYLKTLKQSTKSLEERLSILERDIDRIGSNIREEMQKNREEAGRNAKALREEIMNNIKIMGDVIVKSMNDFGGLQKSQLDIFADRLNNLSDVTEKRLEKMRDTIENRLHVLQEENSKKLEQMRAVVDEKLHATLEKRLGESFKLVSERLELVHKGLGEMQHLASSVGDLKKVLTNIKTRGTWGEMQLGTLLEQILTPEQFVRNVITKKGSNERVEFAIKLPGGNRDEAEVLLPIDAKFPQEDYQKLLDAYDEANQSKIEEQLKRLENTISSEAKKICEKYIDPPNTTDFAIMFLPTEGLFAEALRISGLCERLQREYRVVVTGPTTLAALLNSLQMGFRTLAIEKRSSEVWQLLGAVKTEFGKFGDLLEKTNEKLKQASKTIEDATKKSRSIERKLKDVQSIPMETSEKLLEE